MLVYVFIVQDFTGNYKGFVRILEITADDQFFCFLCGFPQLFCLCREQHSGGFGAVLRGGSRFQCINGITNGAEQPEIGLFIICHGGSSFFIIITCFRL